MDPELEELAKAFNAHHETVEATLKRNGAEIDRLSAALAGQKIGGGSGSELTAGMKAAKSAMLNFARGDSSALSYKGASGDIMISASASGTSGPDGGFTVPTILSDQITDQLIEVSPVRRAARVQPIRGGDYAEIINRRGASSGWAAEQSTRGETNTPQLGIVAPPGGGLYAMPSVTNWLLQDSQYDFAAFLTRNVADEFAFQEGSAFINGDGISKPRGFLTYSAVTTTDPTRPFDKVQYVPTGTAGAFAASNPADKLIDLKTSLRPSYRQGPGVAWMMNSSTSAVIQKFKDGTGQYLWRESMAADQPPTLLGYPVIEAEDMPDIAADAFAVAFGNWRRGYLIVDKGADTIIRDNITTKGFTKFYVERRVHGSLLDPNAVKLLKFAAG